MSKHTPGPWSVKTPLNDPRAFDVHAGMTILTRGYWAYNGEADARLIAAAPDLLEALKALVRHDKAADEREGLEACLERQEAEAAIAKAGGHDA